MRMLVTVPEEMVGAVMGAKGVKVIVVDDAGTAARAPADPEKFKAFLEKRLELWDSLKSNVIENGRLKKGFTNRYHEKMYEKTKEIIQNLPC